jgi:hypothetical protein
MVKVADIGAGVDEEILNSVRQKHRRHLLLADIGWSRLEAQETRARLAAFEEDWDAPGMEGYDDL